MDDIHLADGSTSEDCGGYLRLPLDLTDIHIHIHRSPINHTLQARNQSSESECPWCLMLVIVGKGVKVRGSQAHSTRYLEINGIALLQAEWVLMVLRSESSLVASLLLLPCVGSNQS